MKYRLGIIAALFSLHAQAYNAEELRGDCLAAEEVHTGKSEASREQSVRGARCVGYVSGFVDGYAVSDYLAEKVGVSLNAICIPGKKDLPYRLVLSVLVHLENLPPNSPSSTATLVAAALAKTFPCTDQLEPMK